MARIIIGDLDVKCLLKELSAQIMATVCFVKYRDSSPLLARRQGNKASGIVRAHGAVPGFVL
jgi:hypothetical protein